MWHVGECGVHVVGKMSKDIGMVSRTARARGCVSGVGVITV